MLHNIPIAMDLQNIWLLKEYPKQTLIHLFSNELEELLEGGDAGIILHATHDNMQFVCSPTQNYSITCMHFKGTIFSDST